MTYNHIMEDKPKMIDKKQSKAKLRSTWDVVAPTKVEGKPKPFGTSCHVILPRAWAKKVVVSVTKETWEAVQEERQQK
jgi:hypothetical protein